MATISARPSVMLLNLPEARLLPPNLSVQYTETQGQCECVCVCLNTLLDPVSEVHGGTLFTHTPRAPGMTPWKVRGCDESTVHL